MASYADETTIEVNATGLIVARYAQTQNIDEPLAESRSGTISFYDADGVSSITSLRNSSGTIANSYNEVDMPTQLRKTVPPLLSIFIGQGRFGPCLELDIARSLCTGRHLDVLITMVTSICSRRSCAQLYLQCISSSAHYSIRRAYSTFEWNDCRLQIGRRCEGTRRAVQI
jgi:hypothetical protein